MLAMIPDDPYLNVREIEEIFYQDDQPRIVPCWEHKQWYPMARDEAPSRALVMDPGTIKKYSRTSEEVLRQWEQGEFGPMISSYTPTSEELRAWGMEGSS
ncbi:hypothetical protein LTR70_005121 [Exophiala xenobiotica]|uniref:Uncharacterized protein n=1 Tax=Lithohypha guttulata TaxID=1690604 RepID=A0ABR0KAP7_9EURO|nr:hypothetical protein LTR24_004846 [Lithohypha guttulata]KAK5319219.1 hypothetical protein LTR70_005121 [Exophiala xenobiotica]